MGEVISGERRISTEALNDRAARAASGLASLGVKAGDLIAIYLRNDIPFFEASIAAGIQRNCSRRLSRPIGAASNAPKTM